MRPTRDLPRLQRAGLRRLDRLRAIAVAATRLGAGARERETAITYCVIELHNCWYFFSRSLYISSAFRARSQGGTRITLSKVSAAKSIDDALNHAIRRSKPRVFARGQPPWRWGDEPNWTLSRVLLDCLDEIGASNLSTVTAALSLPVATIGNLASVRNFFAHRGEDTARRLRPVFTPYAISPALRATDALTERASGPQGQRPYPLLVDWIDDVSNVIELIV